MSATSPIRPTVRSIFSITFIQSPFSTSRVITDFKFSCIWFIIILGYLCTWKCYNMYLYKKIRKKCILCSDDMQKLCYSKHNAERTKIDIKNIFNNGFQSCFRSRAQSKPQGRALCSGQQDVVKISHCYAQPT